MRAIPPAQDGAHQLGLCLLQLVSTSLVNTQSIQGFQIAPCPLFYNILTSMYFPYVILGELFKINSGNSSSHYYYFWCALRFTAYISTHDCPENLNEFDMSRIDDLHKCSVLEQ